MLWRPANLLVDAFLLPGNIRGTAGAANLPDGTSQSVPGSRYQRTPGGGHRCATWPPLHHPQCLRSGPRSRSTPPAACSFVLLSWGVLHRPVQLNVPSAAAGRNHMQHMNCLSGSSSVHVNLSPRYCSQMQFPAVGHDHQRAPRPQSSCHTFAGHATPSRVALANQKPSHVRSASHTGCRHPAARKASAQGSLQDIASDGAYLRASMKAQQLLTTCGGPLW